MQINTSSTTIRFLIAIFLIVGLMIPWALLNAVVMDRSGYRDEALRNVSHAWSGPQTIVGPILAIPYKVPKDDERERYVEGEPHIFVMPEELNAELSSSYEVRSRGIFDVPVFTAALNASGSFPNLNVPELEAQYGELVLDRMTVIVGVSDTRGIQEGSLTLADTPVELQAGTGFDTIGEGVQAPVRLDGGTTWDRAFQLTLAFRGTERFGIEPVGDETRITMTSTWPHPSFDGRILPDERTVGSDGFTAAWTTGKLARGYSRILDAHGRGAVEMLPFKARGASFAESDRPRATGSPEYRDGVGFSVFKADDIYRSMSRSLEYGILFIIFTMISVVCIELITGVRFHVVQFGVVGIGLVVFFLTLLSLAEHIGFGWGYLIAAALITSMNGVYVAAASRSGRSTAYVAVVLATLYTALYLLLLLDEYALLVGSGLVVILLAGLMYATYRLSRSEAGQPE